ncbi:4-hydroxythreonine-4-phosphate dehydrogenase PdxA [Halomonas sp. McH1-25]|uniref:4-hydroxythreonine-4-phosphate dehydrogenase PdxA n=1 Tax=unclassified Halomonas TaxID=2609666 RepID=UPI001EF51E7E|nr:MULTISPECIES: 4-hydroxythreonine-4-phosphate dehydrogenase PdxA [unclassified Halomonas]MCG7600645.1 4-hydroxythreonine-4-phosphate dehydrogenase PdxA [Halomonas sp. McH1-25]MCP1341223.1 4-hydroxythreonine-4-phosphate dehydrogenase PdxA [Halomonas sp. FL8]MCP1362907.1 4-hydroxythreonine-4-phosphate dehydrogenase PdxA [Halomonas sp. BBD45]
MTFPILALTTGEPAGIGPDLTLMVAASQMPLPGRVVAVGDPDMLAERAARLKLEVDIAVLNPGQAIPDARTGVLPVWPVALQAQALPGKLDPANADYVLATLDRAIEACRRGEAGAMVTAPLHKGVIIEGGHAGFTGHTEYLRDACRVDEVVMMLATRLDTPTGVQDLRVALATTHLPLREVADAVTDQGLTRVLRILAMDLERHFGIVAPRIAVCGLNPHAGEGGHLGREELEVIAPTLERLRGEGMQLDGPLPADTLFTPRHLEGVDAVLAMYHDQGLPVLKYAGFGRAANITLGLPIVRTSVDHGTALDLAGTATADTGSLRVALEVAAEMATGQAIGR